MSFGCLSHTLVCNLFFPYFFESYFPAYALRCYFFTDTTPLGRIINRFSKDVYTVDEVLPRVFQGYFGTMSRVLGILAVNVIGNWLFIFFIMPLGEETKIYFSSNIPKCCFSYLSKVFYTCSSNDITWPHPAN